MRGLPKFNVYMNDGNGWHDMACIYELNDYTLYIVDNVNIYRISHTNTT